jgi:chitinase
MRALANYSTAALTGLTAFAVACSDASSPDPDRPFLDPGVSAARKKPGTVPPPADTAPPTVPVVSVPDVGRNHISLAWLATDDQGGSAPLYFTITVNGGPDPYGFTWDMSRTYYALQPATTYTFTVRAKDYAGNWSAPSNPLSVTTKALDPSDKQPPSVPTNVRADNYGDGSTEIDLSWTASTDNADSQADIHYEVYVNGELSDVAFGKTRSINYGVNGANTIAVIAVDANGNKSEAGTATIVFDL